MKGLNNLVGDLQKKHEELTKLIDSLNKRLAASDRKGAKKILTRLDDATARHFGFEGDYLYPRMRRLMLEMIDRLCGQQETIKESIAKSRVGLNNKRANRNNLSSFLNVLPLISRHLEDCSALVLLADKFEGEEKDKLSQKLKEYCKIGMGRRR